MKGHGWNIFVSFTKMTLSSVFITFFIFVSFVTQVSCITLFIYFTKWIPQCDCLWMLLSADLIIDEVPSQLLASCFSIAPFRGWSIAWPPSATDNLKKINRKIINVLVSLSPSLLSLYSYFSSDTTDCLVLLDSVFFICFSFYTSHCLGPFALKMFAWFPFPSSLLSYFSVCLSCFAWFHSTTRLIKASRLPTCAARDGNSIFWLMDSLCPQYL